jgi:hypothetical protein
MKKQTMVRFGALVAVALVLGQARVRPPDPVLAQDQDEAGWTVLVTIDELLALTAGDQAGPYDFYHSITIADVDHPDLPNTYCNNEEEFQERSHFFPSWRCARDVTGEDPHVRITIGIWDDDYPFNDNQIDVHPVWGAEYIQMDFWPATHRLEIWRWYDYECAPSRIVMAGDERSEDRARIVFTVTATVRGAYNADSDLDGLTDADEVCGMDGNGDGSIDIDLPGMGANPYHKDLFVELDWMVDDDGAGFEDHSHEPWLPALMNAWHEFDAAPVTNPPTPYDQGSPTGIALHVDVGTLYADYGLDFDDDEVDEISVGPDGNVDVNSDGIVDIGDLGTLGNGTHGGGNRVCANLLPGPCLEPWQVGEDAVLSPEEASQIRGFNFVEARAAAFHYGVFAHLSNSGDEPLATGMAPWGELDFLVSLGARREQEGGLVGPSGLPVRGRFGEHTGTFLHELGHSLGLCHGGGRPSAVGTCEENPEALFYPDRKPNYISVMNSDFQLRGVTYQLDDIGMADPLDGKDFDHDGLPDGQRYTYSWDLPYAEYPDPADPDHTFRGGLPPLSEFFLDEEEGVGDGPAIVFYGPWVDLDGNGECDHERLCPRSTVGNVRIDWNRNGFEFDEDVSELAEVPPDPPGIHLDINRDRLGVAGQIFLTGFNDYTYLQIRSLTPFSHDPEGALRGVGSDEDDDFVRSLVQVIELTEAQAAGACAAESVRYATFEDLFPGTLVTDQYAAQGVYFLADGIRQPTVADPAQRFGLPTSSQPHSLVNAPAPPATSQGVPLVMTFDPPVRVVSLRLGRVTEGDPSNDVAVLTAYDADGFPMGSVQRAIPDYNQGVTAHLAMGAIFPQLLISRVELNYELLTANPLEPEHIDDLIICRNLVPRDPGFPDGPDFGEQLVDVEVTAEVRYPVDTGDPLQPRAWEGAALDDQPIQWERLDAGGDDTESTPFSLTLHEGERLQLTAQAGGFHPEWGPLTFLYWREGGNVYFSREQLEIAARVLRPSSFTAVYRAASYRTYVPSVSADYTAPTGTTVALTPVGDAYISSATPTTNYGTVSTLYVGADSAAVNRSLFRFDLGEIPSGCTVTSALFQAYLADSSTAPPDLYVELRRVDDPWTETGVTWTAQPGSASIGKVNPVGVAPGNYGWDVTGLVQDWLGTTPNHGLALWSTAETYFGWRGFASREAGTPSQPPQLVVTCQP